MSNPMVCAVCLTADRPQYTARAVQCFLSQRYEPKSLLIFDNGHTPVVHQLGTDRVELLRFNRKSESIGTLRNIANGCIPSSAEIIMHWDSDDWSHPYRMGEQVAELERSQRDCVGYPELLFWDSRKLRAFMYDNAGLWHWMPGTTLCYWRRTWRKLEFPDVQLNEDSQWLDRVSKSSAPYYGEAISIQQPRMIAELHAGNMPRRGSVDPLSLIAQGSRQWGERTDLGAYCVERMAL